MDFSIHTTMLFQYVLAALLLAQGCLAHKGRMTEGDESPPHQFPYMVSIVWGCPPLLRYRHLCGGTIINENWILTAGHCITDLPLVGKLGVMAGKHILDQEEELQQFSGVSLKIVHWQYAGGYGPHDIALLKLVTPIKVHALVHPIDLPREGQYYAGQAVIAGWGSVSKGHYPIYPHVLRTATVPLLTNNQCLDVFHKVPGDIVIHNTQLCTDPTENNIAACTGDTGGALIQYDGNEARLIGIISEQKYPCPSTFPTVYTRVSAYTDWIMHKINNAI